MTEEEERLAKFIYIHTKQLGITLRYQFSSASVPWESLDAYDKQPYSLLAEQIVQNYLATSK